VYQFLEAIKYGNGGTQMNDQHILAWHRYAANAPGFIGEALYAQRAKAFLVQEQQRALIGIQAEQYNGLWERLQSMPLPRPNQFTEDLARIVAKVQGDTGVIADFNLEHLEELIQDGLGRKLE
jgi:hypothetical protein